MVHTFLRTSAAGVGRTLQRGLVELLRDTLLAEVGIPDLGAWDVGPLTHSLADPWGVAVAADVAHPAAKAGVGLHLHL
jgi:hypothetical protein